MKLKTLPNSKLKILFLVPYPTEGQSNRFRVEQYLPHLETKGICYSLRPFFSSEFYRILYQSDKYFRKVYFFVKCFLRRIFDLFGLFKCDLVFIHREAFPLGPPFFEILISKFLKIPLIYDFDDSIFLPQTSKANRAVSFLKYPKKVSQIIKLSQQVIVGNDFLREYAVRFNNNVTVIPTPLDTEKYKSFISPEKNGVVIGWIGSHSTAEYLLELKEVFIKLKKVNPDLVIKLIGAETYQNQLPGTDCRAWKLEEEINELNSFDIGLMPMPDNQWTKGKCAFKLLLYMSMAIPAICSPVGMNQEIIRDGENGFLASSPEEWFEQIQTLVRDPDLRKKMGLLGRETVEEKFSLKLWIPIFIDVLEKVAKR
ncbi:MAG: glycosyltransferase family 4 protein [candidate division Zixibacteria bacterium]|nr:glycosyltransferase family 4 protein [candidate division Zixibacteria bacterium]